MTNLRSAFAALGIRIQMAAAAKATYAAPSAGPLIVFRFSMFQSTNADLEATMMERHPSVAGQIAHCTASEPPKPLDKVFQDGADQVFHNELAFLWGAEPIGTRSTTVPRDSNRDPVQLRGRLKNTLDGIIRHLRTSSNQAEKVRTVCVPFIKLDQSGVNRIFDILYNELRIDSDFQNHLAFEFHEIENELTDFEKLDFTGLRDDVRAAMEPHARKTADAIFKVVWKAMDSQLETHRQALAEIPDKRVEAIKDYLARGYIKGRGRKSDHGWGIETMAEECRQRIAAALIREISPAYSTRNSDLSDPETFFEFEIRPAMEAYQVPMSLLAYAAPALDYARKAHRRDAK